MANLANLGSFRDAIMYNITMYSNSEETQPGTSCEVRIPVPQSYKESEWYDTLLASALCPIHVYRCEEDGSLTDMKASIAGNDIVFRTDHFSWYAVVLDPLPYSLPATDSTMPSPEPLITVSDAPAEDIVQLQLEISQGETEDGSIIDKLTGVSCVEVDGAPPQVAAILGNLRVSPDNYQLLLRRGDRELGPTDTVATGDCVVAWAPIEQHDGKRLELIVAGDAPDPAKSL